MKPLRIAVVVGVFPSVSETFVKNQIDYFQQTNHKVTVLCTRYLDKELEFKNYTAIDFKWRALMPLSKLQRVISMFSIIYRSLFTGHFKSLIISLNPFKYGLKIFNGHSFYRTYYELYLAIQNFDVVHIHFADNAVHLLKQLRVFNNKIVVTFHGYDAHKYDSSFYTYLKSLKTAHYTVNTNYTKQKVLDLGFDSKKITIVPVGLDTSFFIPDKELIDKSIFKILFVGRLVEFKAPLLAIKIIEQLRKEIDSNTHFCIVGDGKELENCKAYVKKKALEFCVSFKGSLNQFEIVEEMQESQVFLYPGIVDSNKRCENQGLVIQEAQAMELPVIVSDVGGMKEGLIDGLTGFVIKENDIDVFVDKIKYLIENPQECQKMGKAGRKFIIEHYDNSIIGQQLLDLYKEA